MCVCLGKIQAKDNNAVAGSCADIRVLYLRTEEEGEKGNEVS